MQFSGLIAIRNASEREKNERGRRPEEWGEVWDSFSPSLKAIFYLAS